MKSFHKLAALGFFWLFFFFQATAQQKITISGKIIEKDTRNPIIGATIAQKNTTDATFSDQNGKFSLKISPSPTPLIISALGFKTEFLTISAKSDTTIFVQLSVVAQQIEKIEIIAQNTTPNIDKTQTGIAKISTKEIALLPSFFGTTDIVQAIKLTPGIQSTGDMNAGMYVRGGSNGQNLILLDNMPLYNPTHLLGLTSVFNSNLVANAEIHKSAVPAEYGNRASSVLKIETIKTDNQQQFLKTNVGLLTSGFALADNFAKQKGKILLGARRSSFDIIQKNIRPYLKKQNQFIHNTNYFFFDLNAKAEYRWSAKNAINIQLFSGADKYDMQSKTSQFANQMQWANQSAALVWKHRIHQLHSLEAMVGLTAYYFKLNAGFADVSLGLTNQIQDVFYKILFRNHSLKNHQLTYGFSFTNHNVVPNKLMAKASDFDFFNSKNYRAEHAGLFLQNKMKLSEQLNVLAGVRTNYFRHKGPFTLYTPNPISPFPDSVLFLKNQTIESFFAPEAHIAANFRIDAQNALKLSLAHNVQFLHLISVGSVSLPADIWLPSSRNILPEKISQTAFGYYRQSQNNSIEASAEIYFKHLANQTMFKEGLLNNFTNNDLALQLDRGTGTSYGFELFIKKITGKLTGWISYTLSETQLRFPNINNNSIFPAKYDKTHNLAFITAYKFNVKWNLSALWTFSTGNAITMPDGRYMIQGNVLNHYTAINAQRMPNYHRLDVSVNYKKTTKRNNQNIWSVGLYNAYNRANPYYIFFEIRGNLEQYYLDIEKQEMSLFPILPYIAWSINLNY